MSKAVNYFFCLVFLWSITSNAAAGNKIDSTNWLINFSYGMHLPGKDMKTRFGVNNSFGTYLALNTKKHWEIGFGVDFIFGNLVKEKNQLDALLTSQGKIIDLSGTPVDVYFNERGYATYLSFGKYTNLLGVNQFSGLYLKATTGFIEHWIKISSQSKNSPILAKNYLKGYDRLTNGIFVGGEMGYQFIGNKKLAKFNIGLTFLNGFTQNRRARNFDTGKPNTQNRLDILMGIKLGWSIRLGKTDKEYFYY